MELIFTTEIDGKPFTLKSGKLAKQASGAVVVQYGETIVLVTVVAAKDANENADFLPLSVEYQEKIYAAGRIPGNYFRREIGRPSEKEILTCRLIDRPIRPLFPDNYFFETQVIATVLSMDKENDADILAMVGASAALSISDIPFDGPIGSVRVGRIDGQFKANPTLSEYDKCDINIVIAGSKTGVTMVEGGADIVSEADMIAAINFGHQTIQPLIDIQEQLAGALNREKRVLPVKEKDAALEAKIVELIKDDLYKAVQVPDKIERGKATRAVKEQLIASLGEEYADRKGDISGIFDSLKKKTCRDIVLKEGRRIDGRKFDEIRPIACEVNPLLRPHGSALFTRGETQVLGILTLGSGQDEQRIESLNGDEVKQFMLHYNFPPYSVGECKRMGGPSRRDIGHGALAGRAIEKVLPDKENFDYTIRLVSEVLESNGSSSMGTVCSGIMALMDGGVPIKAPVSGIAMGLVTDGDNTVILSDILGDEDHTGDMDFKVTGTKEGITALQMDIKVKELSAETMEKALEQAKNGRLHILDKMMEAINTPREELSPYAPRIYTVQINPDKIRDVIGPGGKVIRQIQSETNTKIEIDDKGIVKIAAVNHEEGSAATQMVSDIGTDPEVGGIYEGTVVKTTDFGAFVQIKTGTDGLVHISELANYRVKKVTDVIKEGDRIKVKVLEVTKDGKIRLSYKAAMDEQNGSNSQ